MQKDITFSYKSGHECTHSPHVDSDDEWWTMIREIMLEMNKPQPGVFITKSPYGIHKLSDVEAVHFGDVIPPVDAPVPQLGFIKDLTPPP